METKRHTDYPLQIHWSYHLIFWVAYTLFWHSIFSPEFVSFYNFVTSAIYSVAHAAGSYFNVYWLIPRIWKRSRLLYILALLLTITLSCLLLAGLLWAWFSWLGIDFIAVFFKDWSIGLGSIMGSTFSGITLTLALYVLLQRQQWDKQREQLEKEKLQAELQFLRGQLDPHFLFNALNNIYFLIKKDPDRAAEALAGFSELLRYQTYQSQTEQVALSDELRYVEEYVNVNRLRFDKQANIKLSLPKSTETLRIPPLLLLAPIENAFKHLDREQPDVHIDIQLQGSTLQLTVQNRPSTQPVRPHNGSRGIGLTNLRKRLALLFPERHQLQIEQTAAQYKVNLQIELS